jgi:hypothetical protein
MVMLTEDVVAFLVEAKMACYAGNGPRIAPFRPNTYDLKFEKDDLLYYDTYVGADVFAGEEGIWHHGKPIWMMNYIGRLLEPGYNYDFLIEALQHSTVDMPFRGPNEYSPGIIATVAQ